MQVCVKCKCSNTVETEKGYYCLNCGWDSEKEQYVNKITNADRIRSMTDEELAEFLYGIATSHECNICGMKQGWDCGKRENETCNDGIVAWLKSDSEV